MIKISHKQNKGICCPFCNQQTVYVSILTTLYLTAEHYIYEDGLSSESSTENISKLTSKLTKYRCDSCNRSWVDCMLGIVRDEDGNYYFIEKEEGTIERLKTYIHPKVQSPQSGFIRIPQWGTKRSGINDRQY